MVFQSTHPHGVRRIFSPIFKYLIPVSIHAPTRGATPYSIFFDNNNYVSIHAPTRGATLSYNVVVPGGWFQSTHPHGVRQRSVIESVHDFRFQSTHPHGVRHLDSDILVPGYNGFNPRTHTGCDAATGSLAHRLRVSIHAPTRGATP